MSLQPNFRRFHETIKLNRYEENATLVEKRERVLRRLREAGVRFTPFNQGSYAIGTGVQPVDGDFDIDVGIEVDLPYPQQHDPVAVKKLIFDAVNGHTKRVDFRRPCITVYYHQGGEQVYHVDLAVYARDAGGRLHLAVGKQFSAADQRQWLHSDPKGLCATIGNRFSGQDAEQFRRVIRYLKRWRDHNFAAEGNAAPVGIGITAAAHQWFSVQKAGYYSAEYDDLGAMRGFVATLLSRFTSRWGATGLAYRLEARLPAAPHNDVFEKMTDQQMTEFKGRLERLREGLDRANQTGDGAHLVQLLGPDFPR